MAGQLAKPQLSETWRGKAPRTILPQDLVLQSPLNFLNNNKSENVTLAIWKCVAVMIQVWLAVFFDIKLAALGMGQPS